MPDYQGNSKKQKETPVVPPKNIERVVVSEVIVQKKGMGRKFKDLFIAADFKSVVHYVTYDICIPAAKNLMFDALTKGSARVFFGEAAMRRRDFGGGPRVTYNNPINRGYSATSAPRHVPPTSYPEPRSSRHTREEFIISSREEAELVLERMNDIIDQYEVASVADLNDLVGLPTTHVDNKWGWIDLRDVQIRQIREGYLIDFPQAEPMQ